MSGSELVTLNTNTYTYAFTHETLINYQKHEDYQK
jgi:hypothetical protein